MTGGLCLRQLETSESGLEEDLSTLRASPTPSFDNVSIRWWSFLIIGILKVIMYLEGFSIYGNGHFI